MYGPMPPQIPPLARDYSVMMASIQKEGLTEFEQGGRKVLSKQFYASGDTLSAEISYTFPHPRAGGGTQVRKDELFRRRARRPGDRQDKRQSQIVGARFAADRLAP